MKQISRNEYIGIVVAIVIAVIFFIGINFWSSIFGGSLATNNNSLNNQQPMEQKVITNVATEGTGTPAASGDTITVNYVGMLQDGTKFDSSYDRGVPFSFALGAGNVIKGWDDALLGAKVGEKLSVTIPPELGYGASGIPDGKGGYIIPQNATLIFNIEVLKIQAGK